MEIRAGLHVGEVIRPGAGSSLPAPGFPERHSCLLPAAAAGISLSLSLHLHLLKLLRRDFSGIGTGGCSHWQIAAGCRGSQKQLGSFPRKEGSWEPGGWRMLSAVPSRGDAGLLGGR